MRTLAFNLVIVYLAAFFAAIGISQEEGLVLYFSFDEGKGDTVVDQSGNGNNGTLVKGGSSLPTWVDGKGEEYGKALDFPGDGACVEAPDSESLSPLKKVSFAVWIKIKAAPVAPHYIASHLPTWAFLTHGDQATMRRYYVFLNREERGGGEKALFPGQWIHLAFTYDGETIKFYCNGKPNGESFIALRLDDTEGPVRIGASDTDADTWLGAIDEVKIWNRVLTDREIITSMKPLAVEPLGKIAITWGKIKKQ